MADILVLQNGPLSRFKDWPNPDVPSVCAGIYTVWDGDDFLYAGMAGRKLTRQAIENGHVSTKEQGLRKRLAAHAAGQRSGDQFSVYVADRFVLKSLSGTQIGKIAAGTLSFDRLVRQYIHERLNYRWLKMPDDGTAFQLEQAIRNGALPAGLPLLNPGRLAV